MDLHPDRVLVAVLTTCRCAYWHFENIFLPHQYGGTRAVNRPMRRIVLALLIALSAAPLFASDPIVLGPYQYDGAGNIRAIGTNESFLYDRDSRLVTAAMTPGTQTF